MRAEIIGQKGDVLKVKLYDKLDIDQVKKQAIKGRYFVTLEVFEKDSITNMQRDHFYALCGDISEFEGVPVDAVQALMKYEFMKEEGLLEYPSVARNKMKKTTASKLIEFVILHCIHNGIPFRKQQFYLSTDTSKMLFALTLKRLCVVCGKPGADIHHVTAIGMGANRKTHDHSQHEFLALCRAHHSESHTIGQVEFMNKYYVKPVKLNKQNLKELGLD